MKPAAASRFATIWSLLGLVIMTSCVAQTITEVLNANFFTGSYGNGASLVIFCMLAAVDGWFVACAKFTQTRIRWPQKLIEYLSLIVFLLLPWSRADLGDLGTLAKLGFWTLTSYEMIVFARRYTHAMIMDLLQLNQPVVDDPATKAPIAVPLSALQIRIFGVGIAMPIAIAIASGWARLTQTEYTTNLLASAVIIFTYHAIGVLILGQAQFSIQRNSWNRSKASISPSLHKHWLRANLLLIILIACVTLSLPTPVALIPTSFLESNFKPTATPRFTPAPTSTPAPTPTPEGDKPEPTQPDPLLVFIESTLRFTWNMLSPLLAQVAANIQTILLWIAAGIFIWLLWGSFRKRPARQLSNQMHPSQHKSPSAIPSQTAGFTIRRALTSRDQVHGYYMNLLHRARQSGLERHPGQTPYEHTARLVSELPDSQEELIQLTEAFMEARYSQQKIEVEQVNQARTLWQRIRTTLRNYKQKSSRR